MVADVADNTLGKHLRLALRDALKARDMIAVSALRSARAYTRSGHAGQAGRLRREARVLMSALDEARGR